MSSFVHRMGVPLCEWGCVSGDAAAWLHRSMVCLLFLYHYSLGCNSPTLMFLFFLFLSLWDFMLRFDLLIVMKLL